MILLEILLFLLKFIGIALLAILGLILVILCLLLFVPIRYNATLRYKEKIDVWAKVSFLLKLVRVRFELHGKEQKLTAKVLWFNLLSDKGKTQDFEKASKDKKQEEAQRSGEMFLQTSEEVPKDGETLQQTPEPAKSVSDSVEEPQEEHKSSDEASVKKSRKNKDKKQGKRSAKKAGKKAAAPSGKEKGPGSIVDTVRTVVSLIKENKSVLSFLWKQIKALFRHILPGSHVIRVKLGLDDPATLGEIIGAVAVIRAATNLVIDITPDFQEKVIEADCSFKGRIRLGKLLFIALRVYFNKDVKNILNRIKS